MGRFRTISESLRKVRDYWVKYVALLRENDMSYTDFEHYT